MMALARRALPAFPLSLPFPRWLAELLYPAPPRVDALAEPEPVAADQPDVWQYGVRGL